MQSLAERMPVTLQLTVFSLLHFTSTLIFSMVVRALPPDWLRINFAIFTIDSSGLRLGSSITSDLIFNGVAFLLFPYLPPL